MYDHHHSRSDKCCQQTAEVTHSVFVEAYHSHKSKIRGWDSLGNSPQNRTPAKVRVIPFYSLEMITKVTGEPLNFSTANTQLIKTLLQQGMIKRIECFSHIQKCSRGNLSSTRFIGKLGECMVLWDEPNELSIQHHVYIFMQYVDSYS